MKIIGLTTRRVRRSSELWYAPHPVPLGAPRFFEFGLTTLHTDEGVDGYTMDYAPLGQGRASAHMVHDIYAADLIGEDPLAHEAIWQKLRRKQRHLYNISETTWSNLDVALWDIKGKRAGMPVVDLLGRCRDRVPLYATCPPQTIGSLEELETQVRLRLEQGFSAVKLQLSGGPELDVPRLRKAREIAGKGFPLMVDSSAMLTFEQAVRIGHVLDELDYEWFEEPLPDDNLVLLRKLAAHVRTPVLAAETVSLTELPHYMQDGAIDMVRGDVHHKGGITGLMKAVGMCELMGYSLEIHTASSPLLDVANLHVGCATSVSSYLESHHPMFRFGLKNDPLRVREDGCQHVPTAPGLGVEIDWDWMDEHTVEILSGCGDV